MSGNVASAVAFLREPAVASAPISKRVQFLEAKGLSANEIDEALRSVGDLQRFPSAALPPTSPRNYNQNYAPYDARASDWRDWFIMTIVGGGVAYVLTSLARKYVFPALQPPTQAQHQQVQDALTAKYDEAAALLAQLKQDTEAMKAAMDSQQTSVDGAVNDVKSAISEFKVRDEQRTEEIKACKEEIDSIREMLPRMLDKNKEAQTASLLELQNELKSLKSLLSSQRKAQDEANGSANGNGNLTSPFAPNRFNTPSYGNQSSSIASLSKQPGLPSWQLAASPYQNNGTNGAAASSSESLVNADKSTAAKNDTSTS